MRHVWTWIRLRGAAALALLASLWLLVAPAASAATVAPGGRAIGWPAVPPGQSVQEVTLASLGYSDQTLRGASASAEYFFPGPGDVQIAEGSVLRLVVSYSEILLGDRSTLAVSMNGQPVANYRLTAQNAKQLVAQVDLPARSLKNDANKLTLNFAMRIVDDGCQDRDNPGLTATVSNETGIRYATGAALIPERVTPDLSQFPAPFFRQNDPFPSIVNYVTGDKPTHADYTAMASINAKLGQLGPAKTITTTVNTASILPTNVRTKDSLILVGTPDGNPMIREVAAAAPLKAGDTGFTGPNGAAIPADQGIIELVASPYAPNKQVLVVSGGSEEGVRRAGRVLATNSLRKLLAGQYAVVTNPPVEPVATTARDNGRTFSLADLGHQDLVQYGLGQHTVSVSFDAPALADRDGGYIDVVLSHSEPLLPELSSLSAVLNNVPIGSVGLAESNASHGTLRVDIPPATLAPGPNVLQFVWQIQPKKPECSVLLGDSGWGVIHKDTEIHLPQSADGFAVGLQYYPHPWVASGSMNDTILTLPDEPNGAAATSAMQLALDLGRRSQADATWLTALPAKALTDQQRRDSNLIVFGLPQDNKVLSDLNDRLPAPFSTEGLSLRRSGQTLVALRSGAQVGIIESLASPWSSQGNRRAVLVISATSAEGLDWARESLRVARLSGAVATVTRDGRVTVIDVPGQTFGAPNVGAPQQVIPLVATVLVLLLIVSLLVLIVVQVLRERRRRNETGLYPPAPAA